MGKSLILGCVADDFTGASDAASFIAKSGMRTMLFNGTPEGELPVGIDAAVIALKTRTEKKDEAVSDSLKAVRWLLSQGASHIYSKYCSTFDSTPEGNIGPILDAILEECHTKSAILCPGLPVNGRTVRDGILYVGGVPLSESSMKDHPLTPMWDSHIGRLMEPQSKFPCVLVGQKELRLPVEELKIIIEEKSRGYERFYLIPDYVSETDAEDIIRHFGRMQVMSGGSGILTDLGKLYCGGTGEIAPQMHGVDGSAIILAGSCSTATRQQIEEYKKTGKIWYQIQPLKLLSGEETVETIWEKMESIGAGSEMLIYSSAAPEEVAHIQALGKEKAAASIEETLSGLAVKAVKVGYRRVISAGGETSGAIIKALGYASYEIGESIAPGVPMMRPEYAPDIRLVLKSGNFGGVDFFLKALEVTNG